MLSILFRAMNEDSNNNYIKYDTKNIKLIINMEDSNSQLSESSPSSSLSINMADRVKKKDDRLELVEISKGLIEILQNAGFTVEKILENGPSHIAGKLGIDGYVGEIIYNETKKASRNVNF